MTDPIGNTSDRSLCWVTFECGHARRLWIFGDEGTLTHAMCLGEECPPISMRKIVGREYAEPTR